MNLSVANVLLINLSVANVLLMNLSVANVLLMNLSVANEPQLQQPHTHRHLPPLHCNPSLASKDEEIAGSDGWAEGGSERGWREGGGGWGPGGSAAGIAAP